MSEEYDGEVEELDENDPIKKKKLEDAESKEELHEIYVAGLEKAEKNKGKPDFFNGNIRDNKKYDKDIKFY